MKPTKKSGASPAPTNTAVAEYDWSKSQTTGFENVNREDLGIPFLAICQKGSPEFDKTHAEYQAKKIDGIEPGCIFNNLSREIYHQTDKTPMVIVPYGYERLYVEWKPRNSGGGIVKTHKDPNILNECQRNEKNQDILRNGNLLSTTAYFYGVVLRGEDQIPAAIGMTSTQLKKARFWLNLMQGIKFQSGDGEKFTPPMFSHSYLLSTVPEQNEEGSWYGWKIQLKEVIRNKELIEECMNASRRQIASQRTALPAPSDSHGGSDAPPAFA